jgi:predicted Zn-dependent protease
MQTIEDAQKAFDNKHKHALIVLADGKYIVKVLDNVQLYDDTTLPHDLRGKLGMLKLVEAEQMVTGIGCRVSDEIFVVLHESNDEIK